MDRKTSAEFSFLLAIPTILSAGGYALFKDHAQITHSDFMAVGVSFVTALIFAIISVKTFLRFILTISWYLAFIG